MQEGESESRKPDLSETEHRDVEERAAVRAHVVHEAIRREGEDELRRSSGALAWSGLAAGLSMGFSLVAEGLLRAHLPEAGWRPLVSKLGYTIGFVLVILARQQLFTENTLTGIIPLLVRRNASTLRNVARLWLIVLATNLAGAHLFAWVAATPGMFDPAVQRAFEEIGREATKGGFWMLALRGVFAGWLIALMVWMMPAAHTSRLPVVILITYIVALGGFPHIIAGSVDVAYLVMTWKVSWVTYFGPYMIPTLLGNVVGGVALVSALNHAQVMAGKENERDGEL
jgi:formate/nitrite transporter FocA (FNT family)